MSSTGETKIIGAPFLLHETLGCPIANLHSARSDLPHLFSFLCCVVGGSVLALFLVFCVVFLVGSVLLIFLVFCVVFLMGCVMYTVPS